MFVEAEWGQRAERHSFSNRILLGKHLPVDAPSDHEARLGGRFRIHHFCFVYFLSDVFLPSIDHCLARVLQRIYELSLLFVNLQANSAQKKRDERHESQRALYFQIEISIVVSALYFEV